MAPLWSHRAQCLVMCGIDLVLLLLLVTFYDTLLSYSLILIQIITAPDIPVCRNINLGPNYLKVVDHNIYYLVLNKYLTIKYKAENKNGKLITIMNKIFTVTTNALYKNNPDRRSGKEHIFKLFGGVIN